MTRKEQAAFVRDLTKSIADEVIQKLPSIPATADWNGHELRVLLKDKFADAARMSVLVAEPRRRRTREFRNVVITTNL